MALELVTIRCLQDNYAYLVHGAGKTALIDAPEAGPILAELERRGWTLTDILLTHHHDDHTQAVAEIAGKHDVRVIGNGQDRSRLPSLDLAVAPGETFQVCGEDVHVIDVSGHTIGHVAFHFAESALAFTADSLMAMGCGRLFEGDGPMMWASLSRLNALPPDTMICSGHDYCTGNGAFALSVEPDNKVLKDRLSSVDGGQPCAPASLDVERATNPFLRVAAHRERLGMADASDEAVFTRLRQMKDSF